MKTLKSRLKITKPIVRRLKKRKEFEGKNIEFKVEKKNNGMLNSHIDLIIESADTICKNIESGDYRYYVGNTHKVVEVVNGELKCVGWAQANESKCDYIDTLPTYDYSL